MMHFRNFNTESATTRGESDAKSAREHAAEYVIDGRRQKNEGHDEQDRSEQRQVRNGRNIAVSPAPRNGDGSEPAGLDAPTESASEGISAPITEPSGSSRDSRMATGEAGAENAAASSSYSEMHQRPSINDEPYPEAGPQAQASLAGTGTGTLAGREGRIEGEAASADLPTHSHLPEPTSSQVKADSTDGGNPPPSSVQPSDDDVPAFLRKNERCMKQGKCGFASHPNKVTCADCTTAWAIKQRKDRVAA